MESIRPAEVFPPGEFVREELEARGWTQTDLAEILGRPLRLVNEIICGKRSITPETARGLGDAFGTSAQFWLNMESVYQLSRVRSHDDSVARRARLYKMAPVSDMIKRNWIESSNNVEVLEKQLLDFYGIGSLDEEPVFWAHAARKSTSYESMTPAQTAWLFRARRLARAVHAETYSEQKFMGAIDQLRTLLGSATDIRRIPRILADAGIRFLIVEPLPRTRIDGACFWIDDSSPTVAISLRFDRIDAFWHTLMHELGHVRNKDGMNNAPLDTDLVGNNPQRRSDQPDFEKAADEFAVATLVPPSAIEDFISRVRPLYSKARITGFARQLGVHTGIVVGQLQHRGEIGYSYHREVLVKVRDIVMQSALTDGWGYVSPAG